LAYVPGDVMLWPNFTGGEVIDLLGRLRGSIDTARRDGLIERFELDPRKKARAYSKGNRQKVALISALASDVELLLLDEPTAGLDPLMEAAFRACVEEERQRGRTVLLSSHILSEVEALCDRVTIIRLGRAAGRARSAARRAQPGCRGQPGPVRGGHRTAGRAAAAAHRRGGTQPDQPAAHAGAAVPAALRRRRGASGRGRARRRIMTGPATLAGTGALARLAGRRDRIMLPVWVYVLTALVAGTAYTFRKLYPTG